MNRRDMAAGGLFLVLGLALVASGQGFPPGVGGLPGAGFFPQAIGGFMALLAIGVLARRDATGGGKSVAATNFRQVAGTAALLGAYLLLWGTGFFAARTAVREPGNPDRVAIRSQAEPGVSDETSCLASRYRGSPIAAPCIGSAPSYRRDSQGSTRYASTETGGHPATPLRTRLWRMQR